MKSKILVIILLLLTTLVFGQIHRDPVVMYEPPEFLTHPPLWHHTIYDSTNIGYPIESVRDRFTDGYNNITYIRPRTWKPVFDGHYMYAFTTTFGTTRTIFGAILYKMDIRTGEILWQTVFDNRTLDRQEYVQTIELKDNKVELVTMKRFSDTSKDVPFTYNVFGADSYVCVRTYDATIGTLLEYNCWDKTDQYIAVVAPHSEEYRIIRKRDDGTFAYIDNRMLYDDYIDLKIIRPDGKTKFFRRDTMYYPKEKYINFNYLSTSYTAHKMMFLDNGNALVAYNYEYFDDIGRNLYPDLSYIQVYDQDFNPIQRISTGKFVNMFKEDIYDISILHADDQYFTLEINRNDTKNYIISDYDMNIINMIDYAEDYFKPVIGYGMLEYTHKPYRITKTYGKQIPNEIPQFLDYSIYENNQWVHKFSQHLGDNHYLDEIKFLTETPDHDILMCVDHAVYDEDLKVACNETEMWMLIDGDLLGIKTATENIVKPSSVKVFPNPGSNWFMIESDQRMKSLEVMDVFGVTRKPIHIDDFQYQLDLSSESSGMYFVRIIGDYGQTIAIQKLIKKD